MPKYAQRILLLVVMLAISSIGAIFSWRSAGIEGRVRFIDPNEIREFTVTQYFPEGWLGSKKTTAIPATDPLVRAFIHDFAEVPRGHQSFPGEKVDFGIELLTSKFWGYAFFDPGQSSAVFEISDGGVMWLGRSEALQQILTKYLPPKARPKP